MASMEPCSRLTETLSELEAAQKRALIVQKRVQKAGERVEQVKVLHHVQQLHCSRGDWYRFQRGYLDIC